MKETNAGSGRSGISAILLCLAGMAAIIAPASAQYTITTVAGGGQPQDGLGDGGPATSAELFPWGMAVDAGGNLYVADGLHNRVRKVSTDGTITTVAGGGPCCALGDDAPATSANLIAPLGVAVDSAGNVYIADNGTVVGGTDGRIRKVSTNGIIRTYAGGGGQTLTAGNAVPATSVQLGGPNSLVLDPVGNLYFTDGVLPGTVYKVSTAGMITVVAGGPNVLPSPLGNGDGGPATSAFLISPSGIALDSAGNVYIAAKTLTSEHRVRKISTNGIITTFAGSSSSSFSGDGGPATQAGLNFGNYVNPFAGVAVDSAGSVYISDTGNERVRRVTPDGIITTIAGNGVEGLSGDGGPATSATLDTPGGLAVGKGGVLYVGVNSRVSYDPDSARVRALTPPGPPPGAAPSIATGGVVSASGFGQFTSIAPGSWIEIYGSNLSANSRGWAGSDFSGVNAPTSLDGTKVSIGGQPAFIDFISPGQVNAQVPSNIGTGSQSVVVTTANGASSPYTITVNAAQPGLLAPSSFNVGGKQYAVALFSDGVTYVLPPGAIAGVNSRRAQPGDTIILYGVGFGPVVPGIPAGQIVQQSNTLAASWQAKFGGTPAMMNYDGLAPGAVGLYQFNVVVPSVPSSDAVPLTFTLGGVAGTQTLYLPVQNGSAAAPQVQSLTLSAMSVAGGGTVQATVTLSAPAPVGGAVVALSSSASVAAVQATVTVPAGAASAMFTVSASTVSTNQTVTITASYGGGSIQATLTVTPPAAKAAFGSLIAAPITFQPAGYPSSQTSIQATPDAGNTTYTANMGPLILIKGTTSNQGQTFTFSTLAPPTTLSPVPIFGYGNSLLQVSSISLSFTLTPNGTTFGTIAGSLSGTLSVTAIPYPLGGAMVTLSGPIFGAYTAQPAPQ